MKVSRRQFLKTPAALIPSASQAAARKPNILLIVADDLGYGELGCQGNPEIPTPHIDSLARNGVRFTAGYVTAPVCSPSRAGLLTGRYQTRFGHELNAIGLQNREPHVGLPLTEQTLAERMKSAGYATGAIGKWHLGGSARFHPQKRGFEEFFGFLHEGHFYVPPPYSGVTSHLRGNEPTYDAENPILRGVEAIREKEYLTEAFTREARSFIARYQERPFFLYLAYNSVHSPMQAAQKYLNRFDRIQDHHRRVFAAMLSAMDDGVGSVLAELRERKLEEGTLIFFLSDNGGPTEELTSSNRPLRSGKGRLWEGGIRVPFLAQWKEHLPAAQIYEDPVISLDIFATALAAAGVKPAGAKLDGVDLLPYLLRRSQGRPHETLFWRYGRSLALRLGNWKLLRQTERGVQGESFQLFDLASDIGETTNLASQRPELARELRVVLEDWSAQMTPPLWGPSGQPRKNGG